MAIHSVYQVASPPHHTHSSSAHPVRSIGSCPPLFDT